MGAGDIAKCGKRLPGAEATAKLLDEILSANPAGRDGASGKSVDTVVFTLGDNAYRRGTAKEFQECYEPTWGRHKEHTRPAVGNHEYKTPGASPYYDYFGPAAGDPDKGYRGMHFTPGYPISCGRLIRLPRTCWTISE